MDLSIKKIKWTFPKIAILTTIGVLVLVFQNCSNVEYTRAVELPSEVSGFSVTINDGSDFTDSKMVNLSLKAEGAVAVYATNDSTCKTGGKWEEYQSSKEFELSTESLNDLAEVFVKFKSEDGVETPCVTDSIVHDSVPPKLDWLNKPTESGVFSKKAYDLNFDLFERGSGVKDVQCKIDGVLVEDCSYERSLRVHKAREGNHKVTIVAMDHAGNKVEEQVSWMVVDQLGVVSFDIEGGQKYTQKENVRLGFVAENATQMKISQDSLCKTGKVEKFSSAKAYSLKTKNKRNKVYAQFYNDAGDQSPCLRASILHDDQAPVIALQRAPRMDSLIVENLDAGALNIDELGSGLNKYTCSVNSKKIDCKIGEDLKSTLAEGGYSLKIETSDKAGNSSQKVFKFNRLFPLGPASVAIAQAPYATGDSAMVDLVLRAKNAKQVFISNKSNCTVGAWESFNTNKEWRLNKLNAKNTVYVKFRNTPALVSNCVRASTIHDNSPYRITINNPKPVYELSKRDSRTIMFSLFDGSVKLTKFRQVAHFDGCFATNKDTDRKFKLDCGDFGKVSLESLEPGDYKLSVKFRDEAKNEAVAEHSFKLIENYYLCNDPLYVEKNISEKCLALFDDFERAEVDGDSQFNWHTLIDDVLRDDKQNVQANVFKKNQYGFGEAATGNSAAYFTGRKGGSVHEIYMISKPLDLREFSKFEILFNYLPINLETWKWRGKSGLEYVRIDICTASEKDCGLDESRSYNKRIASLKSSNWKPIFTQQGYERGKLTNTERGVKNNGRNHKRRNWLEGSAELDLNSSLIYDKSKVTVRVTISIDEGFTKEVKGNPDGFKSPMV